MKPFTAGGLVYDKASLMVLKDDLSYLRENLFRGGGYEYTVPIHLTLSHTIAVLAHLIEEMEP